jgi:hypothetical protein
VHDAGWCARSDYQPALPCPVDRASRIEDRVPYARSAASLIAHVCGSAWLALVLLAAIYPPSIDETPVQETVAAEHLQLHARWLQRSTAAVVQVVAHTPGR